MRMGPFYEHCVLTQLRQLVADFLQRIIWLEPRAVPLDHLLGKAAVGQVSPLVFLCLSVSYFTSAPSYSSRIDAVYCMQWERD
jgi:hypothetical protein